MSYCVHCGVQLAPDLKECPLCGTVVNDPNPPKYQDPRFVDDLDLKDKNINRHFVVSLITSIMVLPVIVSIIVNIIVNKRFSWSIYVAGAFVCLWVYFVLPFRYSLKRVNLYFLFDMLVTILYVYVIYVITGSNGWFFTLGLPLTLLTGCSLITTIIIIQAYKQSSISIFGWSISITSLFLFGVDLIITHYITGIWGIQWALWATIPLFVIGVTCITISLNHRASEWVKKKLFI